MRDLYEALPPHTSLYDVFEAVFYCWKLIPKSRREWDCWNEKIVLKKGEAAVTLATGAVTEAILTTAVPSGAGETPAPIQEASSLNSTMTDWSSMIEYVWCLNVNTVFAVFIFQFMENEKFDKYRFS